MSQTRYWETWEPTCIKKFIAWLYDNGFLSSNRWFKAWDVGYDMSRQNLNSETQAKRTEGKGKVVSQTGQWETWATTCITKSIAYPYNILFLSSNRWIKAWAIAYDIGFSNSKSGIEAYDVGYAMGWKNLNSETRAERNEWKGKVMLCQRQGSEGHEPPHALKSS